MQGLTVRPGDTGLLLVDVQMRLAGAMPERELNRTLRNWTALLELAARMRLPVAVSEQYPKGLGSTLPVLREILGKISPPPRFVEKLDFDCLQVPGFEQFLFETGRKTWIVAGLETHICVWQTVRGLRERGFNVHLVTDGTLSRRKTDWRTGLALAAQAGAVLTSTETALFDLVHRAEGETFKALSKLVR